MSAVESELSRLQIMRETMSEVMSAPAASPREVPEVLESLGPVPVADLIPWLVRGPSRGVRQRSPIR